MADPFMQNGAASSSNATPYEQEFLTDVEKEIVCEGQDYEKLKNGEIFPLSDMHWGRVKFELTLGRIVDATNDTHKDLVLNVICNRGAIDPHWRIRFTVSVQCNIHQHDEWEGAEQSMTANRKLHRLVLPVMRLPPGTDVVGGATLRIKMKMNSWSGNFPAPLRSFSEKTDITDATLIVEGRQLYVSRAILSIHSSFFHNLFFNRNFTDAAKDEFELPDISFDAMQTFLGLIYPNVTSDHQACIRSMDTIEAMLTLAERFACDSVTRLMEKYLMGEAGTQIEGFTLARRLLLADRFRLSAPCSLLMSRLLTDAELNRLAETEEYNELSDAIRGAILDMRLQGNNTRAEEPAPGSRWDGVDQNSRVITSWVTGSADYHLAPRAAAAAPAAPAAPLTASQLRARTIRALAAAVDADDASVDAARAARIQERMIRERRVLGAAAAAAAAVQPSAAAPGSAASSSVAPAAATASAAAAGLMLGRIPRRAPSASDIGAEMAVAAAAAASAPRAATSAAASAALSSGAPAAPVDTTATSRARIHAAIIAELSSAAPAAAAASSSSSSSSSAAPAAGSTWAQMQQDVGMLRVAAGNFALSLSRSDDVTQAIRYLLNLRPDEYNGVPSTIRDPLHATIRDLIDPTRNHSQMVISAMVTQFIMQVGSVRYYLLDLTVPDTKRIRFS